MNGLYLAVAVALRFATGPATDYFGAKPLMLAGLSSFVIGGALLPLCDGFGALVVLRCVQAIGLAAFWPAATTAVADAAPLAQRGWWLGVYRFVTAASLLLAPVAAFALADGFGFDVCLWVMSLCALVAMGCVAVLPGAPAGNSNVRLPLDPGDRGSAQAARPLSDRLGGGGRSDDDGEGRRGCRAEAAFIMSGAIGAVLGATLVVAAGYGLLFSFARSFVSMVDPLANAGWYFTLLGIGSLISNPAAGALADRFSSRRLLGTWVFCAGAGVALFPVLRCDPVLLGPIFIISGLFLGFGYGGAITTAQVLTASCVSERRCATALSLQQNAIDLGIAGASVLFGAAFAVIGADAIVPFLFQGIVMALAGVALVLMRR